MNIASTVPSGIVVFFSSYKQEKQFYDLFAKHNILNQIEAIKTIFREPKEASQVGKLLNQFQLAVRNRGKAIFSRQNGF